MSNAFFSRPSSISQTDAPLRWNDIEALPVHCALIAMVILVWLGLSESGQTAQLALAKIIGIIGCIALRRAWLKMDRTSGPASMA